MDLDALAEHWKIFALAGLLLIVYAAYVTYAGESIQLAETQSYLDSLAKAQNVAISAANFSAVQGLLSVTVKPDNYLLNATLTIDTDDPQAKIEVYSNVPLNLLSGGTDNATYRLPVTKDPISLDIIFTFTNTTIQHQVGLSIVDMAVTNSTTVYANP